MNIYNIPLGYPFLQHFAKGIINRLAENPIMMGKVIVLLPTRRGCLSLKEIFLQKAKEKPLILPRIYALADLEQEPILPELMPRLTETKVISKWQRRGYLTLLVQQFLQEKELGHTITSAYLLAEKLANLLDEFYISNADLTKLETLVEEDFSLYWQQNLAFLKIISHYWPTILKEKGWIEATHFHQQNLNFIAENWSPSGPVILAGTTGTRPATTHLARAILNFPQGMIVLPGFDPTHTKDVKITHPNYTLCEFVKNLGVAPNKILEWNEFPPLDPKGQLLKQAMKPILPSLDQLPPLQRETSQITLLSCSTEEEEALTIAAILRSVYEQEQGTAALITPDQSLSRRVQAYLKHWEIDANVSAGISLRETVTGIFLSLIARLNPNVTLTDWISLLKHPLFFKNKDRKNHLQQLRQLEKEVLRKMIGFEIENTSLLPPHLRSWYKEILEQVNPFLQPQTSQSFSQWLMLHRQIAIALTGEISLWAHYDGEAAKAFFGELEADPPLFPSLSQQDYAALITQLIQQVRVHRKEEIGSPLRILGTLEARQAEADVIILAGLNESIWPQTTEEGTWLSNQMRLKLGLSSLQRRVGLAAHDFCLGFSAAPEIYMTRSEQQEGNATIPSRLWLHIQIMHQQYKIFSSKGIALKTAVQQFRESEEVRQTLPPQPQVPQHLKPKHYSVTDIERLLRDPYSIYAKNILRLKKLNPLDPTLSLREWGQLIHQILDLTFKKYHPRQRDLFISAMKEIGQQLFEPYLKDVVVRTFWWPRFEQICNWIGHLKDLEGIKEFLTEISGQLELTISGEKITLTTIVDRIDILETGCYRLIDYKTGILPTENDIQRGFSPQLVLEGLILTYGGFANAPLPIEMLQAAYWELKGGTGVGQIKPLKGYITLLQEAEIGLKALLEYFQKEDAIYLSYPWGEEKVRFSDYRHLARVDEWL